MRVSGDREIWTLLRKRPPKIRFHANYWEFGCISISSPLTRSRWPSMLCTVIMIRAEPVLASFATGAFELQCAGRELSHQSGNHASTFHHYNNDPNMKLDVRTARQSIATQVVTQFRAELDVASRHEFRLESLNHQSLWIDMLATATGCEFNMVENNRADNLIAMEDWIEHSSQVDVVEYTHFVPISGRADGEYKNAQIESVDGLVQATNFETIAASIEAKFAATTTVSQLQDFDRAGAMLAKDCHSYAHAYPGMFHLQSSFWLATHNIPASLNTLVSWMRTLAYVRQIAITYNYPSVRDLEI